MPAFPLCVQCLGLGYCRQLTTCLITDAQLNSPAFVEDVRAYARELNLTRDAWLTWLEDAYRDYPGLIVDAEGYAVPLDLSAFETASIRYWFRDFIELEAPARRRRLRPEVRERVRVLATLLRAVDPRGTANWGVRGANDNLGRLPVRSDLSPCPHRGRAVYSPIPANDNEDDDLPF